MKRMLVGAVVMMAAGAAWAAQPASSPELIAKGKTSFTTNCVVCHGEKGDGNGPAGAAMNPKPRNFATEPMKNGSNPENIFATLGTGLPGTTMVAFAHLPEDERWALAYYVNTFVPKAAEPPKADAAKSDAKKPAGKAKGKK